ncbi:MAG TPA: response regulator transcription factor [Nocardioidaceae bacterium]|nr:response regulator transcription factor [Nocardioidaceae bacterium]
MRILVVDDDTRVASAVKRGLEREGYAVDLALDGTEGQWLAAENPYDAMVLDIMLPGMRGDTLCTSLRDAGVWTPILMLTAKSGESEEARALDAGADDFLAKPFSYLVLLARLRALVRRGRPERPQTLVAGDLRLDPAAHQVWRGDVPLTLSPRQFSLLEYLMRHAGDVLPKRRILEHVWDFTFEGDPNIVEVYVRQLRLRIDEPFGRTALETVRGAGYRLAADGG